MFSMDPSEINRLAHSFEQSAANVGQAAQQVVRKTALDIEATAKQFVPVDTGNLKGSIGHSDLRSVGQSGALEARIGPTANYGHYVEFGTSRMGPAAYMGPALDRHSGPFEQAMSILAERAANGSA
jgi:HK97 gp10 family phage protein